MTLQTRNIRGAVGGGVDFTEEFTTKLDFIGAIDTDNKGKAIFDGSGIEVEVTQIIYLEFPTVEVTVDDWVLYDNRRFDILAVENIGELNGILKLECNERGTANNLSSQA